MHGGALRALSHRAYAGLCLSVSMSSPQRTPYCLVPALHALQSQRPSFALPVAAVAVRVLQCFSRRGRAAVMQFSARPRKPLASSKTVACSWRTPPAYPPLPTLRLLLLVLPLLPPPLRLLPPPSPLFLLLLSASPSAPPPPALPPLIPPPFRPLPPPPSLLPSNPSSFTSSSR